MKLIKISLYLGLILMKVQSGLLLNKKRLFTGCEYISENSKFIHSIWKILTSFNFEIGCNNFSQCQKRLDKTKESCIVDFRLEMEKVCSLISNGIYKKTYCYKLSLQNTALAEKLDKNLFLGTLGTNLNPENGSGSNEENCENFTQIDYSPTEELKLVKTHDENKNFFNPSSSSENFTVYYSTTQYNLKYYQGDEVYLFEDPSTKTNDCTPFYPNPAPNKTVDCCISFLNGGSPNIKLIPCNINDNKQRFSIIQQTDNSIKISVFVGCKTYAFSRNSNTYNDSIYFELLDDSQDLQKWKLQDP